MNNNPKKKIFVIGSTGNQGKAVVNELLRAGHIVNALTRNSDNEKAKVIEKMGANLIEGDFSDLNKLTQLATGNDFAFIVTLPSETEAEIGISIVDSMVKANIPHIIFSSVANSDKNTGIPHFESKRKIEKYLLKENITSTIIAPAFLMENIFAPWNLPNIIKGIFQQPLSPNKVLQMLSTRDIGQFVKIVVEDPEKYVGKRIDAAGDEITSQELTSILSSYLKSDITYVETRKDDIPMYDMKKMFEWLEDTGYSVNINNLQNEYPGVKLTKFTKWVEIQKWDELQLQN